MSVRCYGCMNQKENSPVCEHCGYDERSQNNTHQLPAGTEVGGQYILGRVLGQGGFGITYIGWDKIMNQRVAVKEYFPSGYAGRDTLRTLEVTSYDNQNAHAFEANKRRFLREAESLARLWNIPQIVKVLRHFEENGTAYIAMEYAEGMDLRKYMKRRGKPLSMEELMEILGPVIQALEFVHKADLVHRDISPDNIMVLPDGSTKLLDFGAARYVENADAEKDRNTSTQAILKHGFAPPEQYRSHGALGPWTDVYAMCATVYFCLTGRIPTEAMARVMEDLEVGWDKVPGLTEQQRSALDQGMALKPKVRIQSAGELYQKLFGEILEAREKARQEEAEEQRRLEEARRREEERKAEEARRAEEKRRREQERLEAEEKRKVEEQRKAEAKQAEEQRRREEKQKREQARKEAAEAKHRKQQEKAARKEQAQGETRRRPVLPILAALLAVVIAAGLFLQKPARPELAVPTGTAAPETPATEEPSGETQAPAAETMATESAEPAWVQNVLRVEHTVPENYPDDWYAQNRVYLQFFDEYGRYSLFLKDGSRIPMTETGYRDYIGGMPVLGSGILRRQIVEAAFLDSVAGAPADSLDVSADQNGSVLAWMEELGEDRYCLYFAADGGINGRDACESLFENFVELERIRFGNAFHTEQARNMGAMFNHCFDLTELDLSSFDTSGVADMSFMFSGCSSLTELDVSGLDTSGVTDMSGMFHDCAGLTELDVSGFDTSGVTDMGIIFYGCSGLTELDVSGFDTSAVTDMHFMFSRCSGLTKLDLSSFDTSRVTDMSLMFQLCSGLTELDLRGFDTSNVTDMSSMFSDCSGLTELDLSGFDTSNVTDMSSMFSDCSGLTELDLSGFDTSGVTDMSYMFFRCSGLTELDLSGFDTSGVTNMFSMFNSCTRLTALDLNHFDTRLVEDMSFMFYDCRSLEVLYTRFDTSSLKKSGGIFDGCNKLPYWVRQLYQER